ncbi:MAG: hypothetical protein RIQ89_1374 [Bacteroidota bacterium]|jgi:shikimate kinase
MKIFLIGYMGCGKSKTGKVLAAKLNLKFVDLDQLIEEKTNTKIHHFFSLFGEETFRKIETEILQTIALEQNVLIATGGGTPCFNDNMNYMLKHGTCIYLEATVGLLYSRLIKSKLKRPIIAGMDDESLRQFITNHLAERAPIYRKANMIVSAASIDVTDLHEKIKRFYQ